MYSDFDSLAAAPAKYCTTQRKYDLTLTFLTVS